MKIERPAGYWPSPWPGEDGGPQRSQAPQGIPGLGLRSDEKLTVASRDALASTMVILRQPGEVFVLRHTLGSNMLKNPTTSWVERIDPESLAPLDRSPDLQAGPFWPGGIAAHANGSLYTVYGSWCHRLDPDCTVTAVRQLPQARPYNSFVILGDGTIATKDFDLQCRHPAHLSLLDPETLEPRCSDVQLPEPVIARISTDGSSLYLVGTKTVYRYVWDPDAGRLERDDGWSFNYCTGPGQSYGWDPVISAGNLWFLDNGEHTYGISMLGAGVASGPVHLVRVSLDNSADNELIEVCGKGFGAVTDPPLYDPDRRIVLGYDSANAILRAWRFDQTGLKPLWCKPYATASHMIRYPDTGEIVVGDFSSRLSIVNRPPFRGLAMRSGRLVNLSWMRTTAAKLLHDDIVVLDIETGEERGRAKVPSLFQSVLFPTPGWDRDIYYCTFSTIARVAVD